MNSEQNDIKKSSFGRILSKALKIICILVIASVNIFLIWRMLSSETPKELKTLEVNEQLAAAYERYGNEIELFYQEQNSITRTEENYGYFSVVHSVFIPQANQLQIIVRYNNSTLRALAEDYGLSAVPNRSDELYDITILETNDATPEIREDNTNIDNLILQRYFPSKVEKFERNLYNYRKLVFDNITVDELTVGVFVDFYYVGDIDYEKTAYGTLCLYDDESVNLKYKLTANDKTALERYSKENKNS